MGVDYNYNEDFKKKNKKKIESISFHCLSNTILSYILARTDVGINSLPTGVDLHAVPAEVRVAPRK